MKFLNETIAVALLLSTVVLMANLEPKDPVFSFFQTKNNKFETKLKQL
jgi:hypothetical protein